MKDKMTTVCFIVPLPPPYGGIANWYLQIKEILTSKTNVKVLECDISQKISLKYKPYVLFRFFEMISQLFKLVKIFIMDKPNVIHLNSSMRSGFLRDFLFLVLSNLFNKRSILHIRSERVFLYHVNKNKFKLKLSNLLYRLATIVIVIEPNTYNYYKNIKRFKTNKLYYIPNPINVQTFFFKSPAYNIEDENYVIYSGDISKEKGVIDLIEVWTKNFNLFKNINLVLIGRNKLNINFDNYNKYNIMYKGFIDHQLAMAYLKNSRFVVVPSHTEGFPNIVLEAMLHEKEIIATKVGAIPLLLDNNRGILIDVGDKQQLLKSMCYILNRTKKKSNFEKKALSEYVKINYDINKVILEYEKLWL
jgi:glycosyltransferase involved in cell wall biosynthesis